MGVLGQSKHPPHEDQCHFCHQQILWFWRAGKWNALDGVTGQKHTCQEYREQSDRRNGPVTTRRTDELPDY